MRGYILDKYGDAACARLGDVAEPAPGSRDVLVRVGAVGLNPVDYKIRDGMLKPVLSLKLPAVLGNELAGEVVGVGPGVVDWKVGDRVFARVGKDRLGAFAEMACVDESHAARIPDGVDFATAAAVPLAGLTALQALRDELKLKPGMRVLISGGAGGVGSFAIQIAKWLGAHVTTTASPRGEALVRELGADEVVDYTKRRVADIAERFDAGFDLIGGDTLNEMFRVMKPGATVVSVAGLPEPVTAKKDLAKPHLVPVFWLISFAIRARARSAGVGYRYLFMQPSGEDLFQLAELIEQNKLRVIVDRTFRFEEIAGAVVYLEAGHAKGKVVVTLGAQNHGAG